MRAIRFTLFHNWHFMRWLRLGLGGIILVQSIQLHSFASGFVALFFLYQAFTNTGCCGASGCAIPEKKTSTNDTIS